jgi:glucose-1-phosphatase
MIRVILFDLGGVLFRLTDFSKYRKYILSNCAVTRGVEEAAGRFHNLLESGRITFRDYYTGLKTGFGFRKTFQDHVWHFNHLILEGEIAGMRKFIKELQKKNYRVCLLSNTNSIHMKYINSISDLTGLLDRLCLSYKLGCLKPDPKIFRKALKLMKVRADEVLFIDDRADNIETARSEGLHVVLAEKNRPSVRKVRAYLVLAGAAG